MAAAVAEQSPDRSCCSCCFNMEVYTALGGVPPDCALAAEAATRGEYKAAIDALRDAESAGALCARAAAYIGYELPRKAVKDCNAAIKADPSCVAAYLVKGDALMVRGKSADAAKAWRRGLALAPDGSPAHALLETRVSLCAAPAVALTSTAAAGAGAAAKPEPEDPASVAPTRTLDRVISKPSAPVEPNAARGAMVKDVDTSEVVKLIERGHLYVNQGSYADAVKVFNKVAQAAPNTVAVYLGRGSAHAMLRDFSAALRDFSHAIKLEPTHHDALKRRAQVYTAAGQPELALKDFEKALKYSPTKWDVHSECGLMHYKANNFRKAVKDFAAATDLNPRDAQVWLNRGQCENSLGDGDAARRSFLMATSLKPGFTDAYINMASSRRAFGDIPGAAQAFEKALQVDPHNAAALQTRALMLHNIGDTEAALRDAHHCLRALPNDSTALFMAATCLQSLGSFMEAAARYKQLLEVEPQNLCLCQFQVMLYLNGYLDAPFRSYSADRVVPAVTKEGFAKRLGRAAMPSNWLPLSVRSLKDVPLLEAPPGADAATLVAAADTVGAQVQYESPGFVVNVKQHRQFGLAAIEVAQLCQSQWAEPSRMPNDASSLPASELPDGGTHDACWRDVYDTAVRWRQLSEPFDPVWWIDTLTRKAFEEGFGLQTPMISGQLKVVRYYPQFQEAFAITKRLVAEQCALTDDMRATVAAAKTCDDVYAVVRRDMWVTTPTHSTVSPGRTMEGTRLTIQAKPPDGYDFTIRTPGTPERWGHFSEELDWVWRQLCAEARAETRSPKRLAVLVLTSYFYWVNMGPLTRGSAAVGLAVLVGQAMACDLPLSLPCPPGKQLDWIGILSPSPAKFIARAMPLVFAALVDDGAAATPNALPLPSVTAVFPTTRQAVQALNLPRV